MVYKFGTSSSSVALSNHLLQLLQLACLPACRILHTYRVKPKSEDEDLSSQPDSEGYVYTQALARTPVS